MSNDIIELTPSIIILIYLIITLVICVVFKYEPVGAILWILFPIIYPIIWLKKWLKNN